jgi:hypothetical protein
MKVCIAPEKVACWNTDMKFVLEPGAIRILVGPNSVELQEVMWTVRQVGQDALMGDPLSRL